MAQSGIPAGKIVDLETLGRAIRVRSANMQSIRRLKWQTTMAVNNERETRRLYYLTLANKAFGDDKLALKFMTRKHPKLGTSPIKKLDTEWGGRMVESILNSMMYGLPA